MSCSLVWRHLEIERTEAKLDLLTQFAKVPTRPNPQKQLTNDNPEKQYKIDYGNVLMKQKSVISYTKEEILSGKSTYFCSQLVAYAYKHIFRILNPTKATTQYVPGTIFLSLQGPSRRTI